MTITLYSSTAEKNRLNKSAYLTQVASMTSGQLTEPSSLIDPVIVINSSTNYFKADAAHPANYAYIPDFGRYYFIREVVSIAKDLWRVSLHVDVLMTYKTQIANCAGYLNRTANPTYADRGIVDTLKVQTGGSEIFENYIGTFPSTYKTYVTILRGGAQV